MENAIAAITILDEDNPGLFHETELIVRDYSKVYRIDGHYGNIAPVRKRQP